MKSRFALSTFFTLALLFVVQVPFAFADPGGGGRSYQMGGYSCAADAVTCAIVSRLVAYIINPLFALMAAVAVLVFIWGVVEFLWNKSKGETDSKVGREHMLYGLAGLFVLVSTVAIINLIANTVKGLLP